MEKEIKSVFDEGLEEFVELLDKSKFYEVEAGMVLSRAENGDLHFGEISTGSKYGVEYITEKQTVFGNKKIRAPRDYNKYALVHTHVVDSPISLQDIGQAVNNNFDKVCVIRVKQEEMNVVCGLTELKKSKNLNIFNALVNEFSDVMDKLSTNEEKTNYYYNNFDKLKKELEKIGITFYTLNLSLD